MITVRTPVCPQGHYLLPTAGEFACPQCDGQPVRILKAGEEWLPTPAFRWMDLPFKQLNPVQREVLAYCDKPVNLLVGAATSAGKTLVAEMCIAPVVQPSEERGAFRPKAIYLAPLKALAQEKLDNWSDAAHPFSKLSVCIATGDYMVGPERERVLKACAQSDLICMTSEMLDSLTRRKGAEQNTWLSDVRIVVVDESHLIAMDERGDKLESALMRFTAQVPEARLVLLSATMPNVEQMGVWCHRLNGLHTVVIDSTWRPVKLIVNYPTYRSAGGWANYQENRRAMLAGVVALCQQNLQHRMLVFVHSKVDGKDLMREFGLRNWTAEFHNADLSKEDRRSIERRFRDKASPLQIVVATSTLAYGLNLPARVVIVAGTQRGITPVHPYDIRQEVGRCGRFGIDPQGDAYVLVPSHNPAEVGRLQNLPPISSQLEQSDRLLFHLIAEIAEGYHNTDEDLWRWYSRSLASVRNQQVTRESFRAEIERLQRGGLIEADPKGYKATGLGRVASWLYYHPLDVAEWYRNFRTLLSNRLVKEDAAVAWGLANVHTSRQGSYIPKALKDDVADFNRQLAGFRLPPLNGEGVVANGYYLALTQEDADIPAGWRAEVRAVRYEAERMFNALELIDRQYARWGLADRWRTLGLRMKYGIGDHLVELVGKLDGVGPERARKLHAAGLATLQDIGAAGAARVTKVLGKALGMSVWAQAKQAITRRRGNDPTQGS